MMPTFPRSPRSFRTAGFPQYGWKAGLSGGAFPDRQRLKPAPGMHLLTAGLPSPFVHLRVGAVAPYCAGPPTGPAAAQAPIDSCTTRRANEGGAGQQAAGTVRAFGAPAYY